MEQGLVYKEQTSLLKLNLDSKRVNHSWLFTGVNASLLFELAKEFVKEALDIKGDELAHPDLKILDKGLLVDDARLVTRFLNYQPSFDRKFVIINRLETASRRFVNAFLKTLEEPACCSTIIMIASSCCNLPNTFLSRCQIMPFPPLEVEEFHYLLNKEKRITKKLSSTYYHEISDSMDVVNSYIKDKGQNKLVQTLSCLSNGILPESKQTCLKTLLLVINRLVAVKTRPNTVNELFSGELEQLLSIASKHSLESLCSIHTRYTSLWSNWKKKDLDTQQVVCSICNWIINVD